MSTSIYYFSGTGNSLAVARDIADSLGDTQLESIPQAMKKTTLDVADCVGIVFPVYMWGIPLIIGDFIRQLKIKKDTYVFIVATYGGMAGGALQYAIRLCARQGIAVNAACTVRMVENFIPVFRLPSVEKQLKISNCVRFRVEQISTSIRERKQKNIEGTFILFEWIGTLIYSILSPHIPSMDRMFSVTEACNSCNTCVQVCPARNIALSNGKPTWRHSCQMCLACLHWCPKEAIQYGPTTKRRGRYHHPSVSLEDMSMI